jgi:hypothetical protein
MTNEMTTAINQLKSEIGTFSARASVLRKEISMLNKAQSHLRGIPARHNLVRISERENELQSIVAHLDFIDRVGVEEIIRCELCAA